MGEICVIIYTIGMFIVAWVSTDVPEPESVNSSLKNAESDRSQNRDETVLKYTDEKLEEILMNTSIYDDKMIESCRRELQIRQESLTFISFAESKTDEELQGILNSREQYNPAMVRRCEEVLKKRREKAAEEERLRIEEEERLRLAKEEQDRLAAEERRRVLWKKWRVPYFILMAAVVTSVTMYVVHLNKESKARQEQIRIEAENARIAEEQRLEEERKRTEEVRAAKAKAERQEKERLARIAAEEERRIRQEEEKIQNDEQYRHSLGIYFVGDKHESLNGIVFEVDETRKHGKVVSINESKHGWDNASKWCKALGENWRMPVLDEMQSLMKNYRVTNNLNVEFSRMYWTATEDFNDNMYYTYYTVQRGGEKTSQTKWAIHYVRAVTNF